MLIMVYHCNKIYNKLLRQMGCGSSDAVAGTLRKRQTVFGVLEVKLTQAFIEHQTSKVFSMDPYVNVKFSNQKCTGQVVKKGGKNPKFTDVFKFIVNSYYKYYGRCLQVQLMDHNTTSDTLIGYGIIDLDPYLNALNHKSVQSSPGNKVPRQPQTVPLRCFLNFDRQQAGFIMLNATFREEKVENICFRFQTTDLKRKTRTFGEMNVSVRVSIGQQILSTRKSKDTKTDNPVWKDEQINFVCPESVQDILIQVLDDDELIGSKTYQKLDFLKQKQESAFDTQFFYKNEIAGKLKFNTLRGFTSIFKDLNGDYKKKLPVQPKKEQQKDDKKQQGKGEKKEQPKETKKQQTKQVESKPKQAQPKVQPSNVEAQVVK